MEKCEKCERRTKEVEEFLRDMREFFAFIGTVMVRIMGAFLIGGAFVMARLVTVEPVWALGFAIFNAVSVIAGVLFLMANVTMKPFSG
jgi:hypothetical protein